ncbi:MAG: transglycosylase SLT domain-containing protein [Paracoccaceae bacterium]|nr:transglycosylase SLT domain-containing protein [Paracoccaceae bacterium]
MSKSLRMLCMTFLIGSCGILSSGSAPRNLDDACSILQQRPHFHKAFKSTEKRWGVPVNVQMAIIHQESRFRSNAKTPMRYFLGIIPRGRQSSAYGYAQALDGTWNEYKQSTGRFVVRRSNISDATDFMGWYMAETKRRNRISLSNAKNQYLAYHEGQTGYARGSYRKKSWLLKVANKVDRRSSMYRRQLKGCDRL